MIQRLEITVVAEDSVGYETPYLGQHGISLLVDVYAEAAVLPPVPDLRGFGPTQGAAAGHGGGVGKPGRAVDHTRILIDVAQHPQPLLQNMALMQIDPASIDMIVLTHCHYDHTRGLTEVLRAIGRGEVPVVAHPEIFRPNLELTPRLRPIGMSPAEARVNLEAAGAGLVLSRTPVPLADSCVTSGEVPRTTAFEGANAGLYTLGAADQRETLLPDPMLDDLSVFAEVRGIGVVVITGCSHAGIVNIVRAAKTAFGAAASVAAVVGGLHLILATEPTIAATVQGLRAEGVQEVYAGHCTGFAAQTELYRAFGAAFAPLRTGAVFRFGHATPP